MTCGRHYKYIEVIACLEDEDIYTPSTIVANAVNNNIIETYYGKYLKKDGFQLLKLKIRHALVRVSINHSFPSEGDGKVYVKGQRVLKGWKGWRWKAVIEKRKNKEQGDNNL